MRQGRLLPIVALIALLVGAAALVSDASAKTLSPEQQASTILQDNGIKGGIISHVGCGNGELTAALHANDSYLVHGLDRDEAKVAAAREKIASMGLYGKVSIEPHKGQRLPYADNIINLIVVSPGGNIPKDELLRVLTPGGKVDFLDKRKTLHKPWPDDIDEWTHFMYDASGNGVSKDERVRFPRHTQWHAGPRFARHHDALASTSAMTSSKGRLFYIQDEGPISVMHRPAKWRLVARDGFNGKLLWKREIPTWMTHLYNFRAGPAELTRRLVSAGEHVYTTLGWTAPVQRLDAATGKTQLTYPGSVDAEELVLHDGILLVVIGNPERHIEIADGAVGYWELSEDEEPLPKAIIAYDADTGEKLWEERGSHMGQQVPLSLCAQGSSVFYLDNTTLYCLDAQTGREKWTAPWESPETGLFVRNYTPTVLVHEDILLSLDWKKLVAYSVKDGKQLWQQRGSIGFGAAGDLFVIDGKAWTFPMTKGVKTAGGKTDFVNDGKTAVGIDLKTGEIVEEFPFLRTQHHHRCYRNKATETQFLLGHSGIQVIDVETKQPRTHRWVRGVCQYGIMPANGYLYVPPDGCQCYFSSKINGFFALADHNSWADTPVKSQLIKGAAYGKVAAKNATNGQNDWPTYRGNPARSGALPCQTPGAPALQWQQHVGENITAPVIAAGRVYAADRDAFTVHCLDAKTGDVQWKYVTGGVVDSPPTIAQGHCVFGSHDGSVYCLDAATGQLAWRFKTAAVERRIGWKNRLASPLWIHGSVLVLDDTVYFAAGHSSNLDGGIRMYGLNLETGAIEHNRTLASGHWSSDDVVQSDSLEHRRGRDFGILSDILSSSDGSTINMRGRRFTRTFEPAKGKVSGFTTDTAFLDDSLFHRKGWKAGRSSGKLIAFNDEQSVAAATPYTGLKKARQNKKRSDAPNEWNQVGHLHQKFTRYLEEEWFPIGSKLAGSGAPKSKWAEEQELVTRAMVLGQDSVCIAGWQDEVRIQLKDGRPTNPETPDRRRGQLLIRDLETGEPRAQLPLRREPVYDGMAAAGGAIYLSTTDGCISRFSADN